MLKTTERLKITISCFPSWEAEDTTIAHLAGLDLGYINRFIKPWERICKYNDIILSIREKMNNIIDVINEINNIFDTEFQVGDF